MGRLGGPFLFEEPRLDMPRSIRDARAAWWLVALAAATFAAYLPGLSGGFLFDDYPNLAILGTSAPFSSADALLSFLTSGTADPIGRPLALLSFLANARDWPDNPGGFLRLNLFLHVLNAVLLYGLLRRLDEVLAPHRGRWIALLAAAAWALHPLFVSTVLYAVQREAMLPALFVFSSLIGYLEGRKRFLAGSGNAGLGLMACSLAAGTVLASASKANGILLPIFALVLEWTVLRSADAETPERAQKLRKAQRLLLWLPASVVVLYLLHFVWHWNTFLPSRGWSIGQRLMTQPRVLFDYLQLLAIPRSTSSGLFNDDYVVSSGWLTPAATLPAAIGIVGAIALAFGLRRRLPALSAAALFFFAGHLVESGPIPLELYFEHRNYLPAALLGWPLARALATWNIATSRKVALAIGLLTLLGLTTIQRASLWGQPERMAAVYLLTNPDSSRAQAVVAEAQIGAGRAEEARARLDAQWRAKPDDLQIAFNYANAACAVGGIDAAHLARLAATLRDARFGTRFINPWAREIADREPPCTGLGKDELETLLGETNKNPALDAAFHDEEIEPLLATLALRRGEPDAALRHFDASLRAYVAPNLAARQASELAEGGYYWHALRHLDHYAAWQHRAVQPGPGMPRVHAWLLRRQGYWPRELAILRRKLIIAASEPPVAAAREPHR
jgi:tetratricopeptide (TPR) repeat protein